MSRPYVALTEPTPHGADLQGAKHKVNAIRPLVFAIGCVVALTWACTRYEADPTATSPSELLAIPSATRLGKNPSMPFGFLSHAHRPSAVSAESPLSVRAQVEAPTRTLPKEFEGFRSFEGSKGLHSVHLYRVMYEANQRQGSANSKGRGEVRGGGKKPYTQKKTGNARRGSTRSPLMVGGGVIFGPKGGRDWSKKMNKKEKRLAFERMLFERATDGSIELIDGIPIQEGKTKEIDSFISKHPLDPPKNRPKYIVVDEAFPESVHRASANHPHVKLIPSFKLNPYDLLIAHKVLITKQGLEGLLKRLARTSDEETTEGASGEEPKEE